VVTPAATWFGGAVLPPPGSYPPRAPNTTPPGAPRPTAAKPSSAIEAALGYMDEPELIHRDNLVLLA
jgi:glutamate 5-kinase